MRGRTFARRSALVCAVALAIPAAAALWPRASAAAEPRRTQGQLTAIDAGGQPAGVCPLEHTDVRASVSGFLARVTVTQTFQNPFEGPIEAVYAFPLSESAAVDRMSMRVGDRVIAGLIKRRDEARQIYDAAKAAGMSAALLDQERPNIFTQSVANILPGSKIEVTISYVETLRYESGTYKFVFPTVVGPRYVPGAPVGRQGGGRLPDTDRVPDASKITPPVAPEGERAGHDISISVDIDAGVPIRSLRSQLHDVELSRTAESSARVRLRDKATIPNRDFVLEYAVAGERIEDAVLTHRSGGSGYFTLMLQPPARVAAPDVTPKELVFVLDTSGSMNGFPIEKAKEAMALALDGLYPEDTFNLITFAGDTHVLFPRPVRATAENLGAARRFLASRSGGGGTEMMTAIRAALEPSDAQDHVRVVCFMTDGYVGNDMELLAEVRRHPNARVFSFGIGDSVNRYLLEKMAEEGRGEAEFVTLADDGSAAARRFHERVRSPLLTDVEIDWGGLPVADVYPERIPDVFGAKPVAVTGRFTGAARGTVVLKGNAAGRPFSREIAVNLPDRRAEHDVLAKLWARTRIDALMRQDYDGAQRGAMAGGLQETITQLGLEYGLMTQFTSFVAVEERVVTDGGSTRTVQVPVELPSGVNRATTLGESERDESLSGARGRALKSSAGNGAVAGVPMQPAPPPASRPAVAANAPAEDKLEEAREQREARKAAATVLDLVRRVALAKDSSSVSAPGVRGGRVRVRVSLANASEAELRLLRALRFEGLEGPDSRGRVVGWIPLDRLRALLALEQVRLVEAAPR
jgi:Ca-activated chloride channel homolog